MDRDEPGGPGVFSLPSEDDFESVSDVIDEVIVPAVEGDRRAAVALVSKLLPVVRCEAARCVRAGLGHSCCCISPDLLDEVVEEVFQHLFADQARVLRDFDPAQGQSLEAYVEAVVQREVYQPLVR